jgi:hypothetical protein
MHEKVLSENLKEKDHLLNKNMAGSCEHDNESSDSLNDGESLDRLSDYQLHRVIYLFVCC